MVGNQLRVPSVCGVAVSLRYLELCRREVGVQVAAFATELACASRQLLRQFAIDREGVAAAVASSGEGHRQAPLEARNSYARLRVCRGLWPFPATLRGFLPFACTAGCAGLSFQCLFDHRSASGGVRRVPSPATLDWHASASLQLPFSVPSDYSTLDAEQRQSVRCCVLKRSTSRRTSAQIPP